MALSQKWTDVFYTSRDGLRLHVRHYPAAGSGRRAVLCLPGLTRNARDFHDLANVLSDPRGHRRDVYCIDYRGRGLSEYAEDWKTYNVLAELSDVLDFMTLQGLHDVAVVGTSRGGLIAMAMAVARPAAVGAVVLNDIGPVIERDGLARLQAYVGRVPLPNSWSDAASLVKSLNSRAFPAETDTTWISVARQWFNDDNGRPAHAYDQNLSKAMAIAGGPVADMWQQFSALSRVPMLALRGANSDILSASTFLDMQRRHPQITAITVPDQGHAPLLKDADSIGAIYEFLIKTDAVAELSSETII